MWYFLPEQQELFFSGKSSKRRADCLPGRCQARLSWVHSLLVHICSSGMYIVTLWSYVHNFHNIHTGCCNWTGCLLLDSAQRPGNLKLKYVNHPAVYIRWDRVLPWSQRVPRPVCHIIWFTYHPTLQFVSRVFEERGSQSLCSCHRPFHLCEVCFLTIKQRLHPTQNFWVFWVSMADFWQKFWVFLRSIIFREK